MNYQNSTFINMLNDSITYCKNNEPIWIGIPVVKTTVEKLFAIGIQIDADQLQLNQNASGGQVADKNSRAAAIVHRSYKLSCQLSFFAKDTNNIVLLADVNKSESALKDETLDKSLTNCSLITQRARDYVAQTTNYGITTAQLDSIDTEIAAIKLLPAAIHVQIGDNKMLAQNILQTISDSRTLLDQLDDAFEGMIDDEVFIAGWFNVRKIKGRHNPKKAVAEPVVLAPETAV